MLYRKDNSSVITETKVGKGGVTQVVTYSTNQPEYKFGLYVGPSMKVVGAIRAAIMTNGLLRVVETSKFTAASDGGGFIVHELVESGTKKLLELPQAQGEEELPPRAQGDTKNNAESDSGSETEPETQEGVIDEFNDDVVVHGDSSTDAKAKNKGKKRARRSKKKKAKSAGSDGSCGQQSVFQGLQWRWAHVACRETQDAC
jgi:hypothetical protein